jgi:hypothetical protein
VSLFTPQLSQQVSPEIVNPTASTPDPVLTGVQEVGKLVVTGVELFKAKKEKELGAEAQGELNELNRRFRTIMQARHSGGDRRDLMSSARMELLKFKASVPSLSKEADDLFRGAFGTSGGILFQQTPEEKAFEEVTQRRKDLELSGLSRKDANELLALEAQNKIVTARVSRAKAEGTLTTNMVQEVLTGDSGVVTVDRLWFLDITKNIESVTPEQKSELLKELDRRKLRAIISVDKLGTDPVTGRSLLDFPSRKSLIDQITKEYDDLALSINDFETLKILEEVSKELDARSKIESHKSMPTMVVIRQGGGDQVARWYAEALVNPSSAQLELLKESFPALFNTDSSYVKALTRGGEKLIKPEEAVPLESDEKGSVSPEITDEEAVAVGDTMARNTKYADIASTLAENIPGLSKVTYSHPDSLAALRSQQYVIKAAKDPSKYKTSFEALVRGTVNRFIVDYRLKNNNNPTDIRVIKTDPKDVDPMSYLQVRSPSQLEPKIFIEGTGLDGRIKKYVKEVYKTLSSNPSIIRQIEKDNGLPPESLTPERLTTILVNGGSPAEVSAQLSTTETTQKPVNIKESKEETLDVTQQNELPVIRKNFEELKRKTDEFVKQSGLKISEEDKAFLSQDLPSAVKELSNKIEDLVTKNAKELSSEQKGIIKEVLGQTKDGPKPLPENMNLDVGIYKDNKGNVIVVYSDGTYEEL